MRLTFRGLLKQCADMFPSSTSALTRAAGANAAFQRKFGADDPSRVRTSRVLYLDYSDDPWKEASVSPERVREWDAGLDLHYCYTACDGCGHCGAGVPDTNATRPCKDLTAKLVRRWATESW